MPDFRNRILDVRQVAASELVPNGKNWRTHPQAQASALRAVLEDIGLIDVVIARQDGDRLVLIDGHLRQELSTPDQLLHVVVTDLTEEEADVALLTHDPLGEMAGRNRQAVQHLLGDLNEERAERLRLVVEDIRRRNNLLRPPLASDPDDAPPLSEAPPVAQRGDVWLLGAHRLMCGDATDEADVARLMGETLAQAMWTDPPYGVSYVGKTRDALTIENDDTDGLAGLLAESFGNATEVVEPGAPFYIARPPGALSVIFGNAILEAGWQLHEELQWVKDSLVLGHSDYHIRHETIIYGWTAGPGRSGRGNHEGSRWYGDHAQSSVFEIPRPKASRDHPTAKPVDLVARCLINSTGEGDVVLDLFAGSGSTIIAAERTHRRCFSMELAPEYVDVAVARWELYTGGRAVKEAAP